ncbi:hypothetical protein PSHT_04690 [Puccinia striiformis]|uniref:Uncharacterized protein n=2 Tax=Puccinia striiformis TaxID=27350 RepID=A0A2S4WC82_9BASI
MTSIKFLSVLMVIILQGQVVHSRRRSRDSTDKGTSPTNQSSQFQVPNQNGLLSHCNRLPAKCCSAKLRYNSKPAGMKSAPITGGSISGSCSEPVF